MGTANFRSSKTGLPTDRGPDVAHNIMIRDNYIEQSTGPASEIKGDHIDLVNNTFRATKRSSQMIEAYAQPGYSGVDGNGNPTKFDPKHDNEENKLINNLFVAQSKDGSSFLGSDEFTMIQYTDFEETSGTSYAGNWTAPGGVYGNVFPDTVGNDDFRFWTGAVSNGNHVTTAATYSVWLAIVGGTNHQDTIAISDNNTIDKSGGLTVGFLNSEFKPSTDPTDIEVSPDSAFGIIDDVYGTMRTGTGWTVGAVEYA